MFNPIKAPVIITFSKDYGKSRHDKLLTCAAWINHKIKIQTRYFGFQSLWSSPCTTLSLEFWYFKLLIPDINRKDNPLLSPVQFELETLSFQHCSHLSSMSTIILHLAHKPILLRAFILLKILMIFIFYFQTFRYFFLICTHSPANLLPPLLFHTGT